MEIVKIPLLTFHTVSINDFKFFLLIYTAIRVCINTIAKYIQHIDKKKRYTAIHTKIKQILKTLQVDKHEITARESTFHPGTHNNLPYKLNDNLCSWKHFTLELYTRENVSFSPLF